MKSAFYGTKLGLISPNVASKTIRDFLLSVLDLPADDVEIHAGNASRHSEVGYTSRGDLVLWAGDGGSTGAGYVSFHAEANGEPLTVIQRLDVRSYDSKKGVAFFGSTESYEILDTRDIIDSVMWHEYDAAGVIRAIIPRDLQ